MILDQSLAPQRGMPVAPQDDMVVHRDAQPLAGGGDLAGDLDIGAAGGGVARGMVVDHGHSRWITLDTIGPRK